MLAEAISDDSVGYERLAETAAADGEARFRTVLDRLPTGAYTCDPDGLITYYNQHAVSMWGRAPKLNDTVDRFCGSLQLLSMEGAPLKHDECWMALALRDRRGYNGQEIMVQRPDGQRRVALAYANPICDESGKLLGAVNVLVDISERKKAEEAIRQARDAAEAASRAKDRFLAMLSHELRTPLSPIVMTVAAMEADPQLPPQFREQMAVIRRNLDLEVKLIDDLLDVSRVVTGKMRLQLQPVRIHDLLRQVIDNCASDFSAKHLHVHVAQDAENDRTIADAGRLQQVFWNLLRNAAKFTPDGGDIFVRTSNASSPSQANSRWMLEVRDTGVGIKPEAMARIFEAFEQGEDTTTRRFGGLGLGLSIAKAVVEMHGGSISATSEGEDKGATFTVTLNTESQADAQSRAAQAGPANSSTSGGWRVLIVEDHMDTATVLTRLVQSVGYAVQTAHSMSAALELAAAAPFDLLISDIGLPDATGYDLMKRLKQSRPIKGIALSGYGMEEDIQRSKQAGFAEHMVKPVCFNEFQAAMQRLLTA